MRVPSFSPGLSDGGLSLQADSSGLDRFALRGLVGELLVFEQRILPLLDPLDAVVAWTGPLGMAQDFHLPSGLRIEVKAVDHDATQVLINGLSQLDAGGDSLVLAVVRLEDTGREAVNALTVPLLVKRIRARFSESPEAMRSFDSLLRFAGWQDGDQESEVVVRLVRIDEHEVEANFPRLIHASVPAGVVDATYKIALPLLVTNQ